MFKGLAPPIGFKNLGSGRTVGPSKSDDRTVMTKAVMRVVLQNTVEISDVFPPLKTVVVGLNIIIDYTEVCRIFKLHSSPSSCTDKWYRKQSLTKPTWRT